MKYSEFLESLTGCPFCENKNEAICDEGTAYLTYALAPYHPDHLLIITKRHLDHFLDLNESEWKDVELLQKKGMMLLKKLGYKNVSILVREGDSSGKSVSHLHYHLIPNINLGNTDHSGADRMILTSGEVESEIKRLKEALV
ncbi:MAG: HIT family protein [Candidatus Paceibacterota bacterium]|jgi:diadenosine tetraphosphate (Ap4A) HIT family hydrolase